MSAKGYVENSIERGNKQMEVSAKISDAEKVLAFFQKASDKGMPVEEEYIDTYIYLLKTEGIHFDYHFIFQPLAYSRELRKDILGLKMADYLAGSSITLTQKGSEYVKKQTTINYFRELLERIGEIISDFIGFNRKQLSDAIYARIV